MALEVPQWLTAFGRWRLLGTGGASVFPGFPLMKSCRSRCEISVLLMLFPNTAIPLEQILFKRVSHWRAD